MRAPTPRSRPPRRLLFQNTTFSNTPTAGGPAARRSTHPAYAVWRRGAGSRAACFPKHRHGRWPRRPLRHAHLAYALSCRAANEQRLPRKKRPPVRPASNRGRWRAGLTRRGACWRCSRAAACLASKAPSGAPRPGLLGPTRAPQGLPRAGTKPRLANSTSVAGAPQAGRPASHARLAPQRRPRSPSMQRAHPPLYSSPAAPHAGSSSRILRPTLP
jgi:hypothetical protein